MGFEFKDRDIDDNVIVELKDAQSNVTKTVKYKLLNLQEFNSTRKRMSCIFKTEDGKIKLMCKGADSIIHDFCLSYESKKSVLYKTTQGHVDRFGNEGLRTLFVAEKEIDQKFYEEWNKKVVKA